MLNYETAEVLASAITSDIFTNGQGEVAYRLAMLGDGDKDLGGWSQDAIKRRIMMQLTCSKVNAAPNDRK